jgi:hypothetical protein
MAVPAIAGHRGTRATLTRGPCATVQPALGGLLDSARGGIGHPVLGKRAGRAAASPYRRKAATGGVLAGVPNGFGEPRRVCHGKPLHRCASSLRVPESGHGFAAATPAMGVPPGSTLGNRLRVCGSKHIHWLAPGSTLGNGGGFATANPYMRVFGLWFLVLRIPSTFNLCPLSPSPATRHPSPSTVHRSLSTVPRSLSPIPCPPFPVHRPPSPHGSRLVRRRPLG